MTDPGDKRRKKGKATAEDSRLWQHVARTVTPLGRAQTPAVPAGPAAKGGLQASLPDARLSSAPAPDKPLPAMDPHMKRRAGRMNPGDPVLDLHGYTFDTARVRVAAFIIAAAADGCRMARIITGKGRRRADGSYDGLLKRCVPEWLAEPPLRSLVAAIAPASQAAGGEGAIVVQLKSPARGK